MAKGRSGDPGESEKPKEYARWEDVPAEVRDPVDAKLKVYAHALTDNPVEGTDDPGELRLSFAKLDGAMFTALLRDRIVQLPRLAVLDLSRNQIGPAGATALAQHAADFKTLTTLNLYGNQIGPAGATALAAHAADFKTLTTLDLAANKIGPAGAIALAEHAADFNTLTTLILGSNKIGPAGVAALAEHAADFKMLTTLDLYNNEIHSATLLVDLIESMRSGGRLNGKLTRISISSNPLKTDSGIEIETTGLSSDPQPVEEVLTFLQKALAKDAFILREARVVLVGVGVNGKSQLARALGGTLKPGQKVELTDRTKGVDVETIELPTAKHGKVEARLFDCGGQPEQYQIHRVFWESHRNVMMLVASAVKPWGFSGNRGDYFLRMIETEFRDVRKKEDGKPGDTPPVLAVVTHADRIGEVRGKIGYPTPETLDAIKGNYALDLHVVPKVIDAVKQTHFDTLKKSLTEALDRAEGVSSALPNKFGKVREALQKAFGTWKKPKDEVFGMSVADYRKLCVRAGEKDEGQQDIYLRTLAAIGDVIRMANDPALRGTIFNIHWARKSLYGILTDPTVRDTRGGLMLETDLIRITEAMKGEHRSLLLELSEKLGVAFPIDPIPDPLSGQITKAWLIPDLLRQADVKHPWCDDPRTIEIEFGRFLSEAVFLRFVAASRKYIHSISADARRDQVVLTRNKVQVVVRPNYDGAKHAIQLWADPNNPASQQWCESLGLGFHELMGAVLKRNPETSSDKEQKADRDTRAGGNTYNIENLHVHGPASLGDTKEIEKMIDDKSIHIGRDNNAPVGHGQVLKDVSIMIQTSAPPDRKDELQELEQLVKELLAKLPDEKKESAEENYELLVKQATKKVPDRAWYELSAKGLLEASKFAKDFTGNIAGTLLNLGKKMWVGFSL